MTTWRRPASRVLAVVLGSGVLAGALLGASDPTLSTSSIATRTLSAPAAPTSVAPVADPAPSEVGLGAEVSLHEITPAGFGPGDTLTLAGTVTNSGSEPLVNPQALLRFSAQPLDSRDDIARVDSDPSFRRGSRPQEPFQELADTVPPGESVAFSLEVPVDDLGFWMAGVYVMGVDVRADDTSPDAETARTTVGDTRTVVTYLPDLEDIPSVPVATVWGLGTEPRQRADGTFTDDSLIAELGADGRLGRLPAAGAGSPVTWMVDPDLLRTVGAMRSPYTVGQGEDAEPGVGRNEAADWWDAFASAQTDGQTLLTPLADPDIESFADTEPPLAESLITSATEGTADVASELSTDALPGDPPSTMSDPGSADAGSTAPDDAGAAARFTDTSISHNALGIYAAAGVDDVILSPESVVDPPDQPFGEIDTKHGTVNAVVTDAGLDDALLDASSRADPRAEATQVTQRWRAETAMMALEARSTDTAPEPLVAAAPPGWNPATDTLDALVGVWTSTPWITPSTVGDLPRPDQNPEITLADTTPVGVLPQANVSSTAELDATVRHYVAMLAEPTDASAPPEEGAGDAGGDGAGGDDDATPADDATTAPGPALELTVVRSASRFWRSDPAAGLEYTTDVTDRLAADMDQVSLSVPEQVTLSSDTGVFPLTVDNSLDYPVSVRIAVNSGNPDRLRVDSVTEQVVQAGTRATVDVEAEALSNGRVPVNVGLVAADGTSLGPEQRTIVTATDYGAVGWIVVAVGALMLTWSLARRAWRRRHPSADAESVLDDMESGLEGEVPGAGHREHNESDTKERHSAGDQSGTEESSDTEQQSSPATGEGVSR